ncbi:MAG: diaminopimelate epimerase [Eubacteriales bacterium]
MPFTKMEGAGNDYVYVNAFKIDLPEKDIPKIAQIVSDRHFGIGSDGLVLICPSEVADAKMRMFNLDGSEGEMCGNAIRCVAKYLFDHKMINGLSTSIETLAGIKYIDMFIGEDKKVNKARVDMGAPHFESDDFPFTWNEPFGIDLEAKGRKYKAYCVSMGNPHAVIFVDKVSSFDVTGIGKELETHPVFPNRSNIEFVELVSENSVKMRVYERGSAETLACGTGACATAVVCNTLGKTNDRVDVVLLGGTLTIEYSKDSNVFMTGPCREVFSGEIEIEL